MADMGTNSTRLLVADVEDGEVKELERRSTVTRLGRGVDTSRQLATEAIEDVVSAVGEYIKLYEPLEPDVVLALATSAVRDAENSGAFIAELRERFALNARILTGEEEARLTYVGAVAGRAPSDGTLVIDMAGARRRSSSAQAVRWPSIHRSSSGPSGTPSVTSATTRRQRRSSRRSRRTSASSSSRSWRRRTSSRSTRASAVAGTPTSLAAIDQELDPYDPERVHGYVLSLDAIQHMYSMLSGKSLEERLNVPGLHPGRAPTIVAGVVILIQAMRAFGLQEIEVSEHDILYGAALEAAGSA